MKNSPILLTLFSCFAFAATAFGQAGLERQVIGFAGTTCYSNAGATLDFTIGELAVTETRNDQNTLFQGFHQVTVEKTTLHAANPESVPIAQIQVYPNPAQDFLQIDTDTPLHATLFDLHGRPVLTQTHIENNSQLLVGTLPVGTYVLRSTSIDGKPIQSFKIQILR